ncbi:MAG: thioredoxin domain-containing protein [Acuticoccus sp.]
MPHQNRLAHAASPYLLQHADNPVDWWEWGEDALAHARQTNKPILLSVGYAACHWCHVMAHESFEDTATAAVMNEHFVNIKVDREERPDIDQIYMAALHATGEQGGWPMTMFLTSQAEPFYGGTYFPKDARFGRPRFVDVLGAVAETYRTRGEVVTQNVEALRERIAGTQEPADLPADACDSAARQLLGVMDMANGGTRGAPKFPNAGLFELLWRAYARTGDTRYRDAVLRSANRIAMGGIYDHLGGGFARYSVDAEWLVPHFEKMLYDSAQLIGLMSDAWCITGDRLYAERIEETVAWALAEMSVDGLFAASLDADTEGEEGRFYVWSADEIGNILGEHAPAFMAAYGVSEGGNFEGSNVLNRLGSETPGDDLHEATLAACRAKLLAAREERSRPGRDDKLLADWNGLMIAALARAGAATGNDDWRSLAAATYRAARKRFGRKGNRLIHAVRGAVEGEQGFALDYAAMIRAALALHAAGAGEPDALLTDAMRWTEALERHYRTPAGGFFWTADDAPSLVMRPETPADEAVPNANGLMVQNYATLWAFTGDDAFEAKAQAVLRAHARIAADNVFSCASLFNGLDQLQRLAVVTVNDAPDLLGAVRRSGHPAAIAVTSPPPGGPAEASALAPGQAIVCRGGTCSLPQNDETALGKVLWNNSII